MTIRPIMAIALLLLATAASTSVAQTVPLADQPTGQYYYQEPSPTCRDCEARPLVKSGYFLVRKAGATVIGIDGRSPGSHACFRGFLEGDRITQALRVFPPYHPDSDSEHVEELADLSQYQSVRPSLSPTQTEELQTCIQFFWR